MQTSIDTIREFFHRRTAAHIAALNYFAELLGYHFPEHDNDKHREPYLTGYAYWVWVQHHPHCKLLPQQEIAFRDAQSEHHRMQPHHVEHYASVRDIPQIVLTEMICDWHSANNETLYLHENPTYPTVIDWFNACMADRDWTDDQRKYITDTCAYLAATANAAHVTNLWRRVKQD